MEMHRAAIAHASMFARPRTSGSVPNIPIHQCFGSLSALTLVASRGMPMIQADPVGSGLLSGNRGVLLVLFATAAVLAPMLAIGFVSDDIAVLSFAFTDGRPDPARLLRPEGLAGLYYRPLVDLSFALDFLLWGWNPFGFRLTALLLHLIVTTLVFLLIRRLYGDQIIALLGAAFFGVIPIHEMSLFWIAGRTDVLCALFYMISLWLLTRYVQDGRRAIYLLSFAAYLGALLSKEMAFSLPLVAPLVILQARCIRGERASARFIIMILLPYLLLLLALIVLRRLMLENNLIGSDHGLHGSFAPGQIIRNLAIYAGLLVIPAGHHSLEGIISAYRSLLLPGIAVTALAAGALVWKYRARLHPLLFPLLWIIITILPVSRLVMRWYLYIPSIGFCMGLGWAVANIRRRSPRYGMAVLIWMLYVIILLPQSLQWIQAGDLAQKYLAGFPAVLHHTDHDTLTFLAIPSKIGTAPIFNLGFQETVRHHFHRPDLQVRALSKVIIEQEPVHVRMEPASTTDLVTLRTDSNGYFFLDNPDLKARRAIVDTGMWLHTDDGMARILSLNTWSRPNGVQLLLHTSPGHVIMFNGTGFTLTDISGN